MAYTTTWHVLDMQRETSDGYVFAVMVQAKAVDNDDASKIHTVNQTVRLSRPEILEKAYEDLKEEDVLGWCMNLIKQSQLTPEFTHFQMIENEIKNHMEDGLGNGLPWT